MWRIYCHGHFPVVTGPADCQPALRKRAVTRTHYDRGGIRRWVGRSRCARGKRARKGFDPAAIVRQKVGMKFTETALKGVFVIELEKRGDDRGFFARLFC